MAQFDNNDDFSVKVALNKGASAVGEKWSYDQWNNIEKILNPFDMRLKNVMVDSVRALFGIEKANDTEHNYKALGDDFFDNICKRLISENMVSSDDCIIDDGKTKSKKTAKPLKKADVIKRDNSWSIVNKELDSLFSNFKLDDNYHVPNAMNSKYLEIRGIGFIVCARYLIKNKKKFTGKKSKLLFVNNIIVAMQKFMNMTHGLTADSIIDSSAQTCISEKFLTVMNRVLSEVKKTYDYNGMDVCVDTPQLLIYTDFDQIIPKKASSLYSHQVQMIESMNTSIKNDTPLMISLRTMTGTGKTTSALGIAEVVNCVRKYSDKKDLMFIFCCNIRQVMDQVAQLVFNANIPFGIAVIDKFIGLREINNYNCKKDSDRVVTVCGPDACIELLKKYSNTVLFLDEPTIGLDHKTDIAKTNVKLITECLPKWTILSSATLPSTLPQWIIENHEVKYGKTQFVDIYSNKIHIACEIKTLDGNLLIPHNGCTTHTMLGETIERIKANPFVGRTYTSHMASELNKIVNKLGVNNIPNITEFFDNVDNLTADNLRSVCMEMLTSTSKSSDELVTNVCSQTIRPRDIDCIEDTPAKSQDDIVWESAPKYVVGNNNDYSKLGTTDAHRFMRPTLVATIDPVSFIESNFKNLYDDFTQQFGSVKQINDNFEQKFSFWQKQVDRSEKEKLDSAISSKEDRLRNSEDIHNGKPQLRFTGFQINTIEHIRKYAKGTKNIIDKSSVRQELDMTDVMTAPMDIPDIVRVLLACGIGIIGRYGGRYTHFVRTFMDEGKLAYIIADSSIAYGTNVPINIVVVTKEFSDSHSINTIYQLISRAGRVGRSWIAEAFIDQECAKKIVESIQTNNDKLNIELVHLEELHTELVENSCDIDDALIFELARKKIEEIAKERAEQEKRAREEEERIKREQAERLKIEEEKRKLEELKARRTGNFQRITQVASVVSQPPVNATIKPTSGFQRGTNTNTGKAPQSRFDRLKQMQNK